MSEMKRVGIYIFENMTMIDGYAPLQFFALAPGIEVFTFAKTPEPLMCDAGVLLTPQYGFDDCPEIDVLVVPGGGNVLKQMQDPDVIAFLKKAGEKADYVTSVCTGSLILAEAGLLDGRKATSNKMAWSFVTSQDGDVLWQPSARWVEDGKYVTSSGISAGIDMALALIEDLEGREKAENVAKVAEYIWNDDPADDPFAVEVAETN